MNTWNSWAAIPSPLSEILLGGEATGGLATLNLMGDGDTALLGPIAPDLVLVTGSVALAAVLLAMPAPCMCFDASLSNVLPGKRSTPNA